MQVMVGAIEAQAIYAFCTGQLQKKKSASAKLGGTLAVNHAYVVIAS